jgi:hypothetical protein
VTAKGYMCVSTLITMRFQDSHPPNVEKIRKNCML